MFYIVCSAFLHLSGPAPAPQPWRFDIVSALIGAVVALLLAGLAYRFRDQMRLGWDTMVAPLSRLYHWLQVSVEDEYRALVAARARSLVVPGHVASLDAVFVEPKLASPSLPPQSIAEIDALPVGPRVLPLRGILNGHPQLAILGASGAGKTTLLAYVALVCARTTEENAEVEAALGLAQERLPLCVLLSAMDWDETDGEDKRESDSIERLLNAAVITVAGSKGKGMLKALRQRLEAGQAIVLADGWDELSSQQRQQAAAWLSELVSALPGNLWLVGAGARGYAPLTEAGFVPLTLATWDVGQVETFAKQWVEACTSADESPPVALRQLTAELRRAALAGSSPLELVLRVFVRLSGGQLPAGRAPLFDCALNLLLRQEERKEEQEAEFSLLEVCWEALGQVALSLQQEERATLGREEIEAAIESALLLPEEHPKRAAADVFRTLTGERGVLRPVRSDRYAFAHPLWRAYLAARQLADVGPAVLVERLEDSRWAEVFRFYAELGDIGPLVAAWVRSPDDIFRTRLCRLSSWIAVAPGGAAWRDGAMAVLARGFLQPDQPARVRRALAEALAATGVPGITYFFKQALRHPDTGVRVAAVPGLVRAAGESDLATLEAVLEDEDAAVREAAVRGLAYIDPDVATRWLARLLLMGDEALAPAAAKVLAQYGEHGLALLREAIESEDVMVRRAAVFGLAQVGARDLLEQVIRENGQWVVRSAASAALEELEKQEKVPGVAPPVEIEELPWLFSWAASQGQGVGLGDAARQMLLRALTGGDAPVRLAATLTLAQDGRPDDIELLRTTLADPDPIVANAALDALAEISKRYELKIQ